MQTPEGHRSQGGLATVQAVVTHGDSFAPFDVPAAFCTVAEPPAADRCLLDAAAPPPTLPLLVRPTRGFACSCCLPFRRVNPIELLPPQVDLRAPLARDRYEAWE